MRKNQGVIGFLVSGSNPFSPKNFRGFLKSLCSNTSLKNLGLGLKGFLLAEENWLDLIEALDENNGLVSLELGCKGISDENFGRLMEALSGHKSLKRLELLLQVTPEEENRDEEDTNLRRRSKLKLQRTRGVVSLLGKNKTITHIGMDACDEELWSSEVLPSLKINKLRPRVHAIGAVPEELKLGFIIRDLGVIKDDLNLILLYVSEHGVLLAKAANHAP